MLQSYANEFNKKAAWDIRANEGGRLKNGMCYIAGFGHSWDLSAPEQGRCLELSGEQKSSDLFLEKCAAEYKKDCMVIILGGAANPAPQGLHAISRSGGRVLVLSPEASVCGTAAQAVLQSGIGEQISEELELRREINMFSKFDDQGAVAARNRS